MVGDPMGCLVGWSVSWFVSRLKGTGRVGWDGVVGWCLGFKVRLTMPIHAMVMPMMLMMAMC